jgi:hypothetical protein
VEGQDFQCEAPSGFYSPRHALHSSAIHPAAAAATQGQAFHWDKDSIVIQHAQNCVQFTGTWAANGERYRVVMLPGQIGPVGVRGQLQVGAQHICSSSSSDQQVKLKTDLQGRIYTQVLGSFICSCFL